MPQHYTVDSLSRECTKDQRNQPCAQEKRIKCIHEICTLMQPVCVDDFIRNILLLMIKKKYKGMRDPLTKLQTILKTAFESKP